MSRNIRSLVMYGTLLHVLIMTAWYDVLTTARISW
jgi:hypothetical protein